MDMNLDYNTACNAYENEDYKKAFELFFNLAKEGDVSSQMNIANMLLHGLGVKKDEKKAYECYLQAAENEDSEAQYLYAWYCLKEAKEEEGIKYLTLASEAGYEEAVYDLAGIYAHAMYGCECNLNRAVELYEKSVLFGKEEALSALLHSRVKRDGKLRAMSYMIKNSTRFLKARKA